MKKICRDLLHVCPSSSRLLIGLSFIICHLSLGVALTSCSDDFEQEYNDALRVSESYVSIAAKGGATDITVSTAASWAIDENTTIPDWLTVSPTSGSAGETTVTFSAEGLVGARTAKLKIVSGSLVQEINVVQGETIVEPVTIKEACEGADGKTFRVTGSVVRWASNSEKYGNCYIADATGEIQIYGMADKDGKLQNYPLKSWNIELGDEITVEGGKSTYKGEAELVDVSVVSVKKSLVKIVEPVEEVTLKSSSDVLTVKAAFKGKGVIPQIADEYSWIRFKDMSIKSGTPTAVEQNPADTAFVTFVVEANAGADRKGIISLSSSNGSSSSTVTYTFIQRGSKAPEKGEDASMPFTPAEANAFCMALGEGKTTDTNYYVKGKIIDIEDKNQFGTQYGNCTFYISADGTDSADKFYVFRTLYLGNVKYTDDSWLKPKAGDEVIICGKLTLYKGSDGPVAETSANNSYIYSLNGKTK